MVLPCNKSQLEALNNFFNHFFSNPPSDIKLSLAFDLMKPIKDKLNKRVAIKTYDRRSWNLVLTDLQAKSYYSAFQGRYLGESWPYEQLLIDTHLKLIEKTYG